MAARTWHCILPLIENDLVEMPLVAELRGSPTDLAGADPAERLCPAPHGFIVDDDPACRQNVLDHPRAERKADREPDSLLDDVHHGVARNRSPRSMDVALVIIALEEPMFADASSP